MSKGEREKIMTIVIQKLIKTAIKKSKEMILPVRL